MSQIFYVNKATGKNRNNGLSPDAPLKNIQKAADLANDGDVVRVAEGNYYGNLDCGTIIIKKAIQIFGGYNSDFTQRDILTYKTMVQPSYESNGTTSLSSLGTMHIEIPKSSKEMIVDGLIFDRGNTNAYNTSGEGKPEGVFSPRMQDSPGTAGIAGPMLEAKGVTNHDTYTLFFKVACPITIRNCAFINSRCQAIQGSIGDTTCMITNNIFVNSRMAACEITGSSAAKFGQIDFSYNTVLFCWTRTRTFEDMGYGFRYMNGVCTELHHNILGCACFAALDRCRVESNAAKEKTKVTTCEHNRFFCNKQADLMIPGGGKYMRIWANQFEDVEQLAKEDDNETIKSPAELGNKINEAYLKGWINLTYGECSSFDRDSGANQWRSMLGMPMQGTMKSTCSMWANRYPWEEALEMFGAMPGFGAQKPTY